MGGIKDVMGIISIGMGRIGLLVVQFSTPTTLKTKIEITFVTLTLFSMAYWPWMNTERD